MKWIPPAARCLYNATLKMNYKISIKSFFTFNKMFPIFAYIRLFVAFLHCGSNVYVIKLSD